MTGFGLARATRDDITASVELRSVNHRHLDLKIRLPVGIERLGPRLDAIARAKLVRGRIEGVVDLVRSGARVAPRIDAGLAAAYQRALVDLGQELGLPPPVDLVSIVSLPGVIEDPRAAWPDDVDVIIEGAMERAVEDLDASRSREGAALLAELGVRLSEVSAFVSELAKEAPATIGARKARLLARLSELAVDQPLDPARVAQEASLVAERFDVTEELARLAAHVEHFRVLASNPGSGKKLDFLVQELAREANTLGQKASSAAMVHHVVELKSAIERVREQVQNVE
ncbi:MAG: YicC family protein [Deltaproteobacteria bacterium]|nr:YicC family protein [Deltaproteobacteria bacterium]